MISLQDLKAGALILLREGEEAGPLAEENKCAALAIEAGLKLLWLLPDPGTCGLFRLVSSTVGDDSPPELEEHEVFLRERDETALLLQTSGTR